MDNPSRPIRVLVVDDYEPFRRFLHLKLQPRPDLQIVGEASDGLQAVQKAEELQPDLTACHHCCRPPTAIRPSFTARGFP